VVDIRFVGSAADLAAFSCPKSHCENLIFRGALLA
jgi:hypothetical protein